MAILNSKIFVLNFSSKFWEILLAEENRDNSGNFKGYPQIFFFKWSLMNPFNYKLFNNVSTSPKEGPN